MRYVLIRDDDVNFFTKPEVLEDVYGFILERGIPINFSVIPAVNTAAKTDSPFFGVGRPEPFLPVDAPSSDQSFLVTGNGPLLRFLNSIKSKEFLLHGFAHAGQPGRCEFESDDADALADKLDAGARILEKAFGAAPETFVAPQDKCGSLALSLIRRRFKTLSSGWVEPRRLPPSWYCGYLRMKLARRNYLRVGDFLTVEHPGCMFSKFKDVTRAAEALSGYMDRNQTTVIVTHHWEFFDDGVPNKVLLDAFRQRITGLMGNCEFLTFSGLHRKIFS